MWNLQRGIPPLENLLSFNLWGLPRLHFNYSTLFVKSKHFFEKIFNIFISCVQIVKNRRSKTLISENLLTELPFYGMIIFGGHPFGMTFFVFMALLF